jgi:hypothetical protein
LHTPCPFGQLALLAVHRREFASQQPPFKQTLPSQQG